jgi:hypothetical protein
MDTMISADEVLSTIKNLQENRTTLNKKKVKQSHPDLMRSALFYFPSWEHAIENADTLG